MKKLLLTLTFLVSVSFAHAAEDPKYKIIPTKDSHSPTGLYIPLHLEDCFNELQKMLHSDCLKEFKAKKEKDLIEYHMGLGMWLRNNWGLWGGSRLAKYFNQLGIFHPDDMSGIIIDSFWRHLNDKPIKLEEQIKFYKEYQEKQKKE